MFSASQGREQRLTAPWSRVAAERTSPGTRPHTLTLGSRGSSCKMMVSCLLWASASLISQARAPAFPGAFVESFGTLYPHAFLTDEETEAFPWPATVQGPHRTQLCPRSALSTTTCTAVLDSRSPLQFLSKKIWPGRYSEQCYGGFIFKPLRGSCCKDPRTDMPQRQPTFICSFSWSLQLMESGPCLGSALGVEFKEAELPHCVCPKAANVIFQGVFGASAF